MSLLFTQAILAGVLATEAPTTGQEEGKIAKKNSFVHISYSHTQLHPPWPWSPVWMGKEYLYNTILSRSAFLK